MIFLLLIAITINIIMKIKITSTYALVTTALAVLVSSCGSNVTVAKRYHSGGFNFSFGGGSDGEKAVAKTTVKKPVIKKIGKMPAADVAEETAIASVAQSKTVANYAEAALKANQQTSVTSTSTEVASVLATKAEKTSNNVVVKSATVAKHVVKSAKTSSGPGKSQVIALVLAILVGVIGVHRFYLGYPMEGVLQLLTGGGCGIWTLIDIIRIITGDLQPADGEYEETL